MKTIGIKYRKKIKQFVITLNLKHTISRRNLWCWKRKTNINMICNKINTKQFKVTSLVKLPSVVAISDAGKEKTRNVGS